MTNTSDRMPGEPLDPEVVEFVRNPEPRCACVLLLDTSSSMGGAPIAALNDGVRAFKASLEDDPLAALRVETAIVAFNSEIRLVQDFVTVDRLEPEELCVYGNTGTAQAVMYAMEAVGQRKQSYKDAGVPYYRPWVVCITDGASTDSRQMMDEAVRQVRNAEEARALSFFCVAVEGADMEELRRMAPGRTAMLKGTNFREFFEWLSSSMTRIAASQVSDGVDLPDMSGWASLDR